LSWLVEVLFGTFLNAAKEWVAEEIAKAAKRDRAFSEEDDAGDRLADQIKNADNEKEKRDAAEDAIDSTF